MLTSTQLQTLPINSAALKLVPESVAREFNVLAISVNDHQLHLVLPSIPKNQLGVLLEKLGLILDRRVSHDVALAADLSRAVDLHYSGAYWTVQNCGREFQNRCPKNWADLSLTNERLVRWCSTCDRKVTFCLSDLEVDRHAQAGDCVAYYDGGTYTETLGLVEFPP